MSEEGKNPELIWFSLNIKQALFNRQVCKWYFYLQKEASLWVRGY